MMATERVVNASAERQARSGVHRWVMGGQWTEQGLRSPPRDLDLDELFADSPELAIGETLSSSVSEGPPSPKSCGAVHEKEVNGHGEWAVEPMTAEQRRAEANRERARRLRASQSPTTRLRNLERNRERARQRRALLSPSAKESKLEKDRERARRRRATLSPDTKRRLLEQNRERARRRRANQSPSARQRQLERGRERARQRRANQSPSTRQRQLEQARERAKQRRGALSPEERQVRLERDRERARRRRATSSPSGEQVQGKEKNSDEGDSLSPPAKVQAVMKEDSVRVYDKMASVAVDCKEPALCGGERAREFGGSVLPTPHMSIMQDDQYRAEPNRGTTCVSQYFRPLPHKDEKGRQKSGGGGSPWIHIRTEL